MQDKKKVLKIGLVQDGKLIEDAVLSERQGVTIGLDPSNTLSIAEPNIPRRHLLLNFSGDEYHLHLLEGMKGRLLVDDQTLDLADAAKTKRAVKTAKGYEINLAPNSKGKITIGRSTVLFQLVPPPPPPPIMQLPKELKGGLFKSFDWFFLVVLLISALMHSTLIMYLNSIPYSEVDSMQLDTERFVQVVQAEDIILPEEEEYEDEELTKRPASGGGGGGAGNQGVENKGILALITRDGSNGNVGDLLAQSGLGGNLDDVLSGLGGVRVGRASDEGIGSGTRGSGTGGPGSGSGVGIGDIGSVGRAGTAQTGQRQARTIRARMSSSTGGISGKIDAAQVRGIIRSRVGAIRHCYEMQLKVNPSLKGTIRVQFTIGASGSVSSCSVLSNSMGNTLVADCVCRRVRRWRFPPPEEGSVTVPQTFVFTPVD